MMRRPASHQHPSVPDCPFDRPPSFPLLVIRLCAVSRVGCEHTNACAQGGARLLGSAFRSGQKRKLQLRTWAGWVGLA
eukprot:359139-Chlamydomonas_euryale.AAC.22